MRGVNKVIIVGVCGKDPTVRYTASGSAIAGFSLATNEEWRDKQSGEKQSKTEWHNITAFGKLGEIASEYLKKGSQVYIEGKLQTDKWEDKDGNTRYTTKVIANELQMLGGKPEQSSTGFRKRGGDPAPASGSSAAGDGFEDDDIPF